MKPVIILDPSTGKVHVITTPGDPEEAVGQWCDNHHISINDATWMEFDGTIKFSP